MVLVELCFDRTKSTTRMVLKRYIINIVNLMHEIKLKIFYVDDILVVIMIKNIYRASEKRLFHKNNSTLASCDILYWNENVLWRIIWTLYTLDNSSSIFCVLSLYSLSCSANMKKSERFYSKRKIKYTMI